jgi:hypothetical protein
VQLPDDVLLALLGGAVQDRRVVVADPVVVVVQAVDLAEQQVDRVVLLGVPVGRESLLVGVTDHGPARAVDDVLRGHSSSLIHSGCVGALDALDGGHGNRRAG